MNHAATIEAARAIARPRRPARELVGAFQGAAMLVFYTVFFSSWAFIA